MFCLLVKSRLCVDFASWYIDVRWSSTQIWKIFTEVEFVGREEIEETSKDSIEIGRQRERESARVAGLERPRSNARSTGGGTGRLGSRPVCTTCTGVEWSTARSIVAWNSRPPGQPTESMAALCWVRLTGPVDHGRGSVNRPVVRQTRFGLPFWIRIPFLFGIESNRDFLKPWDSVAINKG